MKVLVVAMTDVLEDSWTERYTIDVTKLVESYGGRYVARTTDVLKLEGEGEPPEVMVVMEFPSKEIAMDFYSSKEYEPYLRARKSGAVTDFFLIPYVDEAKLNNAG